MLAQRSAGSHPIVSTPLSSSRRFTVPPTPPQIHRRLKLTITEDGVLLRPKANGKPETTDRHPLVGVLLHWGVRGKVEAWQEEDPSGVKDDNVELGGILGVVRLWDGESSHLNIHEYVYSLRCISRERGS